MRHIAALAVIALALTACNDPNFRIDPLLATDTVEVFAPSAQNEGRPTALDVTSLQLFIQGARFPERAADAEQWDFAVRVRDGELTLVPASVLGLTSRAAIAGPLLGQTFGELREAPTASAFAMDRPTVMRVGEVYAARSRQIGGSSCIQFSKFQPLEVNAATGLLRLQIVTNERCGDLRLVMED